MLIERNRNIHKLLLAGCVRITDVSLQVIVTYGKQLVILDASSCLKTKKEGVSMLIDRLPVLLQLDVSPLAMYYQ